MIKCGVCGSENEAAALFCGTCGSPLSPAEAQAIVDDATKVVVPDTQEPDESVVPGKGGARRDLGIGGGATTVPDGVPKGTETEVIADLETTSGGPTITCGVCGTVNDATRTYCRKCANELKPAPPPPPPPPPPTPARRISPLAIALGAGAVLVAIALIGVILLGGGTPGASLNPTARASTVPSEPIIVPTDGPTELPNPSARVFDETELTGQIAFAYCPADGTDCAIYLRPADSSENARRIIGANNVDALDPVISPDGKKILYGAQPGLKVVTISSRTFVSQSTGSGDKNPDWHPDGEQLAFAGHRGSDNDPDGDFEIRIDSTDPDVASRPLTDNDILDNDPVFTPDGLSIVWVEGDGDDRELRLIDIESGDVTELTNDEFSDEDPAVSPDGTEVVFTSMRGDSGGFDLYILTIATLEITPLMSPMDGDELDPAFSPGGRYIVFSAGGEGDEDLYIFDRMNDEVIQFTDSSGRDLGPSWR